MKLRIQNVKLKYLEDTARQVQMSLSIVKYVENLKEATKVTLLLR